MRLPFFYNSMFFATMSLARSPAVSDEVSDEAMLFLLFLA
jgi:hypothetical protein